MNLRKPFAKFHDTRSGSLPVTNSNLPKRSPKRPQAMFHEKRSVSLPVTISISPKRSPKCLRAIFHETRSGSLPVTISISPIRSPKCLRLMFHETRSGSLPVTTSNPPKRSPKSPRNAPELCFTRREAVCFLSRPRVPRNGHRSVSESLELAPNPIEVKPESNSSPTPRVSRWFPSPGAYLPPKRLRTVPETKCSPNGLRIGFGRSYSCRSENRDNFRISPRGGFETFPKRRRTCSKLGSSARARVEAKSESNFAAREVVAAPNLSEPLWSVFERLRVTRTRTGSDSTAILARPESSFTRREVIPIIPVSEVLSNGLRGPPREHRFRLRF